MNIDAYIRVRQRWQIYMAGNTSELQLLKPYQKITALGLTALFSGSLRSKSSQLITHKCSSKPGDFAYMYVYPPAMQNPLVIRSIWWHLSSLKIGSIDI